MSNGHNSAFPVPNSPHHGLTKREHMALQIFAGLVARDDKYLPSPNDAVRLADRLLEALEPEPAALPEPGYGDHFSHI